MEAEEQMTKSLCIWCNVLFLPQNREELALLKYSLQDHRLFLFDPKEDGSTGASAEALENADIAFGTPDADAVIKCEKLKWIQTSNAGYTAYD